MSVLVDGLSCSVVDQEVESILDLNDVDGTGPARRLWDRRPPAVEGQYVLVGEVNQQDVRVRCLQVEWQDSRW